MASGQDFPLSIPEPISDDLLCLARESEHLQAIIEASDDEPPAASIDGISSRVASKADVDAGIVHMVVTALWNIKNLQRGFEISSGQELVDQISKVFATTLKAEDSQTWQSGSNRIADALDKINEDHAITISAKASSLAYMHQRLMMNAKLITDVRPVFNVSGDTIVEMVITHTLVMHYRDSLERKMITFAMDNQDVINLRKQCERAERKARATFEALQANDLNPVLIPEETEDGA